MGRTWNAYRVLVGKPERKRPFANAGLVENSIVLIWI
jgi:hypothetical protein